MNQSEAAFGIKRAILHVACPQDIGAVSANQKDKSWQDRARSLAVDVSDDEGNFMDLYIAGYWASDSYGV